jgi:hypothetical protein
MATGFVDADVVDVMLLLRMDRLELVQRRGITLESAVTSDDVQVK